MMIVQPLLPSGFSIFAISLFLALTIADPSAGAADSKAAEYQAAYQRLQKEYSLERVARERIEVDFDALKGMARPLSYRVPIQVCHHPDLVFLQPDMSISLGTARDSLGIGFAAGNPVQLPDMWKISRRLYKGALPVVESEWRAGDIMVAQTAFSILPGEHEVITGKEPQYVIVRIKLTNTSNATRDTPLLMLFGKMGDSQNATYGPYLAPPSRWQTDVFGIEAKGASLTRKGRLLLTWKCNAAIPVSFHAPWRAGEDSGPTELTNCNNCLRFDVKLKAGETRTIDFVVSGTSQLYPESERERMERVTFDSALTRIFHSAVRGWGQNPLQMPDVQEVLRWR
jgi:hypothetical protein